MWTICWTSAEHGDGWERFKSCRDIANFADMLVREGHAGKEDILIFSPAADSYTIPYDELEIPDSPESVRLKCRTCGVPLVWKNKDADMSQMSSEYLGGLWPICKSCMIEHCTRANCSACNYGRYPDCRFLKLKSEYLKEDND